MVMNPQAARARTHKQLADLKHGASIQDDGQHFNLGELRVDRKLQLHQLADAHDSAAVVHVCTRLLLPRFVACNVEPLFPRRGRDFVVAGRELRVATRPLAVLLPHRVLELQVRHAHTTGQARVEVLHAATRHFHNVELARIRFHLSLYFKLRSEQALQLLVQPCRLLRNAGTDRCRSRPHIACW